MNDAIKQVKQRLEQEFRQSAIDAAFETFWLAFRPSLEEHCLTFKNVARAAWYAAKENKS